LQQKAAGAIRVHGLKNRLDKSKKVKSIMGYQIQNSSSGSESTKQESGGAFWRNTLVFGKASPELLQLSGFNQKTERGQLGTISIISVPGCRTCEKNLEKIIVAKLPLPFLFLFQSQGRFSLFLLYLKKKSSLTV